MGPGLSKIGWNGPFLQCGSIMLVSIVHIIASSGIQGSLWVAKMASNSQVQDMSTLADAQFTHNSKFTIPLAVSERLQDNILDDSFTF